MAVSESSIFPLDMGVKQGCALTPIIFNLFLVAIIFVSHCDLQPSDTVGVEFRLDGSLFSLRRLQSKTKTF